jgi:hypothetical protein
MGFNSNIFSPILVQYPWPPLLMARRTQPGTFLLVTLQMYFFLLQTAELVKFNPLLVIYTTHTIFS